MKKFLNSLPAKLLLGILVGTVLGRFLGEGPMQVVVAVKNVVNQVIMFIVPLIVIAFIAPSITKLGSNASRMLGIAVVLAYGSTVLACFMSMGVGYALIPGLAIKTDATVKALPEDIFALQIPQIMPVMSALIFALLIGLAAVWAKAETTMKLLAEFQDIILKIVEKVVIPVLPIYIALTFCCLSWDGTVTEQFPAFVQIILIVIVMHFVWMAVLYGVAGLYSKKNPSEVFRHYGPAYLTAVGTMSSAATLSVALKCAHKSKVLRKDMVDFGIPLFANIHLCGSALTEVFFCMAINLMLYGTLPSVGTMVLFIMLLGIFAVGAPGVPGGTVMASLGIVTSVLGFDPTGTALILAIFALQDSFGTACNVTSDGALTLILTGYCEKHGVKNTEE
ncbi:MAG: dicarboxylate/amino acid:cation symporter [Lachnospiraceae bacterium]|nr:dicarboxylate/amino acid:cation symporter [Candidatus Hippenecus merdae]MCQ2415752.1 dicarboxylate/amino acid:cation symporter [Lachnospiraceae bacterium]